MCMCVHFMNKNQTHIFLKSTWDHFKCFHIWTYLQEDINKDTTLFITFYFLRVKEHFITWNRSGIVLNTLKGWLINGKTIHLSSPLMSLPFFHQFLISEEKISRSILSKAVAVPTCRVRNGALDQTQKPLEKWSWCFLDLHSLENHGKKKIRYLRGNINIIILYLFYNLAVSNNFSFPKIFWA